MMSWRFFVFTCTALSAPFVACSASDESADDSGNAERSSSPRAREEPAENGAAALAPAPCGEVTCELPPITLPDVTPLPPCCVDEAAGICGLTGADGACLPAPEVDWTCPSATVEGVGDMAGCCVNANCGVDATVLGIGCIVLDDPRLLAIHPTAPEPRPCGDTEWASPDAG